MGYSDSRNQSIDDYHVVSGYERDDGGYVEPYVRGDPDGVEENNIEYMREDGDNEGLIEAYIDAYSN